MVAAGACFHAIRQARGPGRPQCDCICRARSGTWWLAPRLPRNPRTLTKDSPPTLLIDRKRGGRSRHGSHGAGSHSTGQKQAATALVPLVPSVHALVESLSLLPSGGVAVDSLTYGGRGVNAHLLRESRLKNLCRSVLPWSAATSVVLASLWLASGAQAETLVFGGGGDSGSGFGTARPAHVWLGGDSSTYFYLLHWSHWGRRTTRATGRGHWQPPYVTSVRVRLLGYDVGYCYGRRAYEKVKVADLVHGHWTRWLAQGVCQ